MPCFSNIRVPIREGTVIKDMDMLHKAVKDLGWSLSGNTIKTPTGAFTVRQNSEGFYETEDAPQGASGQLNIAYKKAEVKTWATKKGFLVSKSTPQQLFMKKY